MTLSTWRLQVPFCGSFQKDIQNLNPKPIWGSHTKETHPTGTPTPNDAFEPPVVLPGSARPRIQRKWRAYSGMPGASSERGWGRNRAIQGGMFNSKRIFWPLAFQFGPIFWGPNWLTRPFKVLWANESTSGKVDDCGCSANAEKLWATVWKHLRHCCRFAPG